MESCSLSCELFLVPGTVHWSEELLLWHCFIAGIVEMFLAARPAGINFMHLEARNTGWRQLVPGCTTQ